MVNKYRQARLPERRPAGGTFDFASTPHHMFGHARGQQGRLFHLEHLRCGARGFGKERITSLKKLNSVEWDPQLTNEAQLFILRNDLANSLCAERFAPVEPGCAWIIDDQVGM